MYKRCTDSSCTTSLDRWKKLPNAKVCLRMSSHIVAKEPYFLEIKMATARLLLTNSSELWWLSKPFFFPSSFTISEIQETNIHRVGQSNIFVISFVKSNQKHFFSFKLWFHEKISNLFSSFDHQKLVKTQKKQDFSSNRTIAIVLVPCEMTKNSSFFREKRAW